MIRAEGLSKTYRIPNRNTVEALKSVTVTIPTGQFVIISGPSGSGKSTLLNLLGLLDHPTSGRLLYRGEDVTDFSEEELCRIRRQRVGFIFQGFNLLPRMTAWENVAVGLLPQGIPEKERFLRASTLLDQLGLHERIFHRPEELSGGEQQRVSVARALINNPDLIIADEPTSNIDAASALKVLRALEDLREKGCTVLLATHDADQFQRTYPNKYLAEADAVYHLFEGRIEERNGDGGCGIP